MPDIIDMAAVRRAHRGHWFDPSSMRFFRSRVGSYAWRTDDRQLAGSRGRERRPPNGADRHGAECHCTA